MSTAFGHLPLIFKLFYAVILWEYHRVTGIFEIRKKNWVYGNHVGPNQ